MAALPTNSSFSPWLAGTVLAVSSPCCWNLESHSGQLSASTRLSQRCAVTLNPTVCLLWLARGPAHLSFTPRNKDNKRDYINYDSLGLLSSRYGLLEFGWILPRGQVIMSL